MKLLLLALAGLLALAAIDARVLSNAYLPPSNNIQADENYPIQTDEPPDYAHRVTNKKPTNIIAHNPVTPGAGFAGNQITEGAPAGAQNYPGQYYPGQGFPGQGFPGQGFPGQGFPGQGFPGQGFPGQGFPGTGFPGQGFPGQGFPGQGFPGHGFPGQGFPGQGFPGQGFPGQGFPGQGFPGQGFPGQGFPGQGFPGQGFPGQGFPGQGFPHNPGFNGFPPGFDSDRENTARVASDTIYGTNGGYVYEKPKTA